jgi:hypothetical protein
MTNPFCLKYLSWPIALFINSRRPHVRVHDFSKQNWDVFYYNHKQLSFLPGTLGRATGDEIFYVADEYLLEIVLQWMGCH